MKLWKISCFFNKILRFYSFSLLTQLEIFSIIKEDDQLRRSVFVAKWDELMTEFREVIGNEPLNKEKIEQLIYKQGFNSSYYSYSVKIIGQYSEVFKMPCIRAVLHFYAMVGHSEIFYTMLGAP